MNATANQNPGVAATDAQVPANPTAFWLSLAGFVIQGVAAVMVVTMFSFFSGFGGMMGYYGGMMGGYCGTGWYGLAGVWLVVEAVALVLGVLGLVWMNSSSLGKVRNGSMLLLVVAVVAFPTMWGFWVGSILMFVGAVMGLTTIQPRT
ncbi:MAG: hypothetical protein LYZ70_02550 [Nitrososphaerales archaeon]|nr:hypothetical protein [Nitrososphaerales archaeon]